MQALKLNNLSSLSQRKLKFSLRKKAELHRFLCLCGANWE